MFVLGTPDLISQKVEYKDRRSWFATLMAIRQLEEIPEPNLA